MHDVNNCLKIQSQVVADRKFISTTYRLTCIYRGCRLNNSWLRQSSIFQPGMESGILQLRQLHHNSQLLHNCNQMKSLLRMSQRGMQCIHCIHSQNKTGQAGSLSKPQLSPMSNNPERSWCIGWIQPRHIYRQGKRRGMKKTNMSMRCSILIHNVWSQSNRKIESTLPTCRYVPTANRSCTTLIFPNCAAYAVCNARAALILT